MMGCILFRDTVPKPQSRGEVHAYMHFAIPSNVSSAPLQQVLKPVFVPKARRETAAERAKQEKEEKEKEHKRNIEKVHSQSARTIT